MAYITHPTTKLNTKPAPFMAAFSSKGPNPVIPGILKVCKEGNQPKNGRKANLFLHIEIIISNVLCI